ncbi:MAG: LacI family transcriptional regulator [Actinomycetia bacterium]|nr:LacI family transcriptional regulator [Actinomycetes bacterium]
MSGGNFVSKNIRDRVLGIIKEKEYKPSIMAQSLRTNRTRTIGLVLADIENPFYSRVAKGVIDAAETRKYNVILCNSNYDIELEERDIRTLMERGVDGLLLTTVALKMKTIEYLLDRGFSFILIDCKLDTPGVNYVVNDDYFGAKLATEYLIELGHKKIFFLGDRKLLSLRERLRGFKDTLEDHKIESINTLVPQKFINMHGIYDIDKIIEYIINREEKITAVFAGNDYWAIKSIKVINDNGLKVPEDISVIGYDNIEISSMVKVPLTTIRQPKYLLGKLAAEQLFEILENSSNKEIKRIILRPELVIRQSCKRIGNYKS